MLRKLPIWASVAAAVIALVVLLVRGRGTQAKTVGGSTSSTTTTSASSIAPSNQDPLEAFHLTRARFDSARPLPAKLQAPIGYVGTAACVGCHKDEAAKLAARPMGHSGLHRLEGRTAALDAMFDGKHMVTHVASGFSYRPLHDEHGYFVEERLDAPDGKPMHVRREPVTISFTAAALGTAFGFERGGRFYQVPIDWYPATKTWALDPGYVQNGRFSRVFGASCVGCHSEVPSHVGGNDDVIVGPLSEGIGCERCHGPGAKHVETTLRDDIVDPARLSLSGQLDVCASCHLEGTAEVKGVHWVEKTPRPDGFTLVSAADRLVRSPCFVKSSGKLGCTSCHDAHASDHDVGGATHMRTACLGCHEEQTSNANANAKTGCKAPESARAERKDDCASCHMAKDTPSDFRAEVPGVRLEITDHWIQKSPAAPRPLGPGDAKTSPSVVTAIVPWKLVAFPASPLDLDPSALSANQAIASAWTIGLENEAIPRLVGIAKNPPAMPELYRLLGDVYSTRLDGASADPDERRHLAERLFLARAMEAELSPDDVTVLVRYAEAASTLGELAGPAETAARADAELALRRALAILPDDATALLELGGLLYRSDRTSEALPLLARAAELGTDALEAHVVLGVEARKKGDLRAAAKHFGNARDAAPRDRFVLEQLAFVYGALHEDKSAADVTHALAFVPKDERPLSQRRATRFLP